MNTEINENQWIANQLGLDLHSNIGLITTMNYLDTWVEYIQIVTPVGKLGSLDTIYVMGEAHKVDSVYKAGATGYVVTDSGEVFADYFITRIEKYQLP